MRVPASLYARFAALLLSALLPPLLVATPAQATDGQIVYRLTFTDYESGSVEDWLQAKGFKFEQDATKRDRIDYDVSVTDGLVIETRTKAFGFITDEAVNVPTFTAIELDWGVIRFPDGVSYQNGVRNEAIMVHVFMGDERVSSGSMFIPDSPYFIGLFLCDGDDDLVDHPYVGSYFKKGGRYVCLEKPEPGVMVTSRYDLLTAYRQFFDKEGDDDPAISGIGIEVDTSKAKGDGIAKAFIREIRFYR